MPHAPRTAPSSPETASPDTRPVPARLLAAAMELIKNEGLQGLSQARVAAAAGLRQSHLTYYFPTRKDLLKALVETIHAELKEAMGTVVPADESSATSVEKVREFFAQRLRNPLMARLMLALMNAADEDASLRRWLVELDNDLIGRLREVFTRLGLRPTDDELALLHTNFVGIAITSAHDSTQAGATRAAHLTRLAFDRLVQTASPTLVNTGHTHRRPKAKR
jgi:AcrR family transcriptional regulator